MSSESAIRPADWAIRPIVISRFFSDARVVAYLAKEPGSRARLAELLLILQCYVTLSTGEGLAMVQSGQLSRRGWAAPGWGSGWTATLYHKDVDFLASSKARNDQEGFVKVKRAQWIGDVFGEKRILNY